MKYKINLFLTNKCNLNCNYCTQEHNEIKNADIDKFTYFLQNNLQNIDTNIIYISGGEPTLSNNFYEWIELLLKYFNKIHITTNGTTLPYIIQEDNIIIKNINRFIFFISYNKSNNYDILYYANEMYRINKSSILSIALNEDNIKDLKKIIDFNSYTNMPIKLIPIYSYEEKNINYINDELKEILTLAYSSKYKDNVLNFRDKHSEDCINFKLTYSWNDNIYGCYISSDIYYDFNNKYKIGQWDTKNIIQLDNRNILYENIPELKSYDGTLCKDCKICNTCKLYSLRGHRNHDECELNRMIDEIKNKKTINIFPRLAHIFLTEMCNLRCTYCFEENKPISSKLMPKDIFIKTLNMIYKSPSLKNNKGINLFGGEPTLHKQAFYWLIDYIKDNYNYIKIHPLDVEVSTNLFKIDDEIIKLFKKLNDLLTPQHFKIGVSLDGIKEAHNQCRVDINNNGSYDNIMSNIKHIKSICPELYINLHCVLSNINMKYTKKIFENLHNLVYNKYANSFSWALITADTTEDVPNYTDIEYIVKAYYDLLKENKYCKEYINEKFVSLLPLIYDNTITDKCTVCDAGETSISVLPNGNILPCHRYITQKEKFIICNINDCKNNYIEVDKDDKIVNQYIVKEWTNHLVNFEGIDCNTCPINKLCHVCVGGNELSNDIQINTYEKCERSVRIAEIFTRYKLAYELEKQNKLLENLNSKSDTILQGQICLAEVLVDENNSCDVDK